MRTVLLALILVWLLPGMARGESPSDCYQQRDLELSIRGCTLVVNKGAERGYWLPVDAAEDEKSHWISNADITDTLKAMKAKPILVVADSCYSGSLTRGLVVRSDNSIYIADIVGRRARTVLTSGGLEPVLDAGGGHSVFAKAFLNALRANIGVIDGEGIYHQVYEEVRLNAEQEPGYGNIRLAGHDGGDFLFVRKR